MRCASSSSCWVIIGVIVTGAWRRLPRFLCRRSAGSRTSLAVRRRPPGASAMRDIVIFGTRNFAEIAHYYFTHDSEHRVVAFTVDGEFIDSDTFAGLPVV